MHIRNLTKTPLSEIHSAFEDAFSEYEIKIQMPMERLEKMMITRSFDPGLSLGYFSENRLAGFILVGHRKIDKKDVCYDIATGIIHSFQKNYGPVRNRIRGQDMKKTTNCSTT
ncbi:MAG: hypothetical protein GY710_19570 [Desulfobacteraceae bacterium]|nr:hypothetical protein [Desulfobacteraceae bacterium]